MDRLEFSRKAVKVAKEQAESSSCESDGDWKFHEKEVAKNEELAVFVKAKEILEDAALDIEDIIEDMK